MNEYTKDYGKVGLTFEHYLSDKAVEELTLVAYDGELYVSLRGTVMNDRIPTASDDWFKISTFGDLLDAIRQVKADSEQLKVDIENIKKECEIVLGAMKGTIEAELQSIETRATAAIKQINDTNNSVKTAEAQRVEAENLRKQAETLRAKAEDARILAESLRSSNESKRAQQEARRVSEFAGITESWAHLQTSINTTIETASVAAARAVEAAQQVEDVIVRANAAADHANTEAAKIQPALDAMDAEFRSKEAQRDNAVDEATKVSQKVHRLNDSLGTYSPRTPLTLQIDKDNMAINATTGQPVVKQGWAISKPFTIVHGNEYLIKVGQTDGDVWCAAKQTVVPAWDEEVKDPETGEVIDIIHHPEEVYYSKKSRLNAGAELPEDGYLRVFGMSQDFSMVVSYHKATADTTVIVLRDGLTANICTQVGEVGTAAEESLDANMQNVAENVGNVGNVVDTMEYRIGQYPQTLLGHGTPSASVRPVNLGKDKFTGLDLPWFGTPEFIGQMYINLDAASGGIYYTVPSFDTDGNISSLKWCNA